MNKSELRWTEVEEANLPQNPTPEQLRLWRMSKGTVVSFEEVYAELPPSLLTDNKTFLLAEQHKHGLSYAIKRHRSHPERQTDIRPQANENLPFYLQDVEKFNPELMTAAKTEVHLSLPTMTEIEKERRLEEESHSKSWSHGVVLRNYLGFQLSTPSVNLDSPATLSNQNPRVIDDDAKSNEDTAITRVAIATNNDDKKNHQDDTHSIYDDAETSHDDARVHNDDVKIQRNDEKAKLDEAKFRDDGEKTNSNDAETRQENATSNVTATNFNDDLKNVS